MGVVGWLLQGCTGVGAWGGSSTASSDVCQGAKNESWERKSKQASLTG